MPEKNCERCGETFEPWGEGFLDKIGQGLRILNGGFDAMDKCKKCYYVDRSEMEKSNFKFMSSFRSLESARKEGDDVIPTLDEFKTEVQSIIDTAVELLAQIDHQKEEDRIKALGFCYSQFHKLAKIIDYEQMEERTEGEIKVLKSMLM
ncbi:hypothetical protein CEE37_07890 [candidate division LCP-89 bacterium B3_LCP]|uniref:Uncharacterized protein n=1 Tax=candidate division LCP-89 bacterium B3_LCP TaxID=2012998 RepID=A0A532UZT0_UNCL8|nr:MAG: hypothetical protein CEE37_07890 [candidate division LCP-89 bacterium B3_LCP]